MEEFLDQWGKASFTAIGFFWKSGWAFVLGYGISAMIQAFVPKVNLTRYMGKLNVKSVSVSTAFGAISSSCSFAALATARSLFLKGAHFITAVAFMFASTNLVIELGILIFIFLGPEYVVAEIIGGLILIAVSSILIKLTYPKKWINQAREKVEQEAEGEEEDFDWRKRIKSKKGWYMVSNKFVMEWGMAWEDILIGFTIAGFVAVFVPNSFWETIFLQDLIQNAQSPSFLIRLENAAVAPFVAAMTFIGSMGNIPLATVLAGSGVAFAGVMGFIYSDLMVPPLVDMNRKYYGIKVALYIAVIMYVSIVFTALLLNYGFELVGFIPESTRKMAAGDAFKIDYTFWFNLFFIVLSIILVYFYIKKRKKEGDWNGILSKNFSFKRIVVYIFSLMVFSGLIIHFIKN
ncbi:permease [Christiangramia fulva]|uniref:Permease n=1 Tax=Christiangramia fulva TaxID=2126553 RepID=A0A2R3Z1Y7_9FLAO|nr:permease [Christiangramia fulva]AVR44290.1 permease [Christiangramia fulva]